MAITISAENYPALGATAGIAGKRANVVYVNYGASASATAPKWVLLGGLINSSISYSAEVNQANTKETNYWSSGVIVGKSAEISMEIMAKRDDSGQKVFEKFMVDDSITSAKQALNVALVDLDDKTYTSMWICPSSWEVTADAEDFVQISCSATVIGAPEQKTNFTVGA